MLFSETIDVDNAEEQWRRIVGILLRINGKIYAETYNLSLNMHLNLALILIKFLKKKPSEALRLAFFEIYALYKDKYGGIIKDTQFISEGDVLDLVRLKTKAVLDLRDTDLPPSNYVKNDTGGFRVAFVNRYIKEFLERPKHRGGVLDHFSQKKTVTTGQNYTDGSFQYL